jgi:hypothetical protein
LSFTVGIFSPGTPPLLTLTALIPFIPIWAVWVYIISHITCPSPFTALMSTPDFVWCLLGALPTLVCVGELRPVNVAIALLIFILLWYKRVSIHNIWSNGLNCLRSCKYRKKSVIIYFCNNFLQVCT